MNPTEPQINGSFRVSIAGERQTLEALRVSEVSVDMSPLQMHSGGGGRWRATRSHGETSRLRIEWPLGSSAPALERWWRETMDSSKSLTKRAIDIVHCDSEGNEARTWRVVGAWPCKMGVGPLCKGDSTTSLTQFFEFAYEGWEQKAEAKKAKARESDTAAAASAKPSSPPGPKKYGPRILIGGDAAYQSRVAADLDTLATLPSGQALLTSLNQSGNDVTIVPCQPGEEAADPGNPPYEALIDGTGKPVQVTYSATQFPMYQSGMNWDVPPPAIILGHELIHASHMVNGNMVGIDTVGGPRVPTYGKSTMGKYAALEERRTVGLSRSEKADFPDFTEEPFTENKLRAEMGEPPRTSYLDPTKGGW